MSVSFTAEELERRARAWSALSNLFVDTDVSLLHSHIARELAQTSYTDAELLSMIREEVGPTYAVNLLSIAGEWVGWSAEETRKDVMRFLRSSRLQRWFNRTLSRGTVERAIADHWPSIRALRILEREP